MFSQKLNPNLETVALEGAHASVIGGAPAAAVVFAREVERAAARDRADLGARRADRQRRGRRAPAPARRARDAAGPRCWPRSGASSPSASTQVHSVERAVRVGSVSRIVAPESLRGVPDRRRRARHGPIAGRSAHRDRDRRQWTHRAGSADGRLTSPPARSGWATGASRAGRAARSRRVVPTGGSVAGRPRLALGALARRGASEHRGARGARRRARGVDRTASGCPCRSRSATAAAGRWRSSQTRRGSAGCDLELIEPRSDAFVREWLAPPEQRLVLASATPAGTARQPDLDGQGGGRQGAARGAAARRPTSGRDARRTPLTSAGAWRPLRGRLGRRRSARRRGWWRAEPGWVMAVAGESPTDVPRELLRAQQSAR